MNANHNHLLCVPYLGVPIPWLGVCRAQKTDSFKSTFVAEDPKNRKKARLSWYHPDDTVCSTTPDLDS